MPRQIGHWSAIATGRGQRRRASTGSRRTAGPEQASSPTRALQSGRASFDDFTWNQGQAPQALRRYSPNCSAYLRSSFLCVCIGVGPHEMQRDVRFVSHDPTIVPRRYVKDVATLHFDDSPVVHCRSSTSRKDHSDVLDSAALCPCGATHVQGPLPSWLVSSSTDGHSAQMHQFKLSFFKCARLVRLLKALQDDLEHGFSSHSGNGRTNRQLSIREDFVAQVDIQIGIHFAPNTHWNSGIEDPSQGPVTDVKTKQLRHLFRRMSRESVPG